MSGVRTMFACLQSVVDEAAPESERPLRIADLVGEQVIDVTPHPHRGGFFMRFGDGAKLYIPSGVALDAAGLPVIEP